MAVVEGVQVPVLEGEAPVAVPDDTLSVRDAVALNHWVVVRVQPKLALPVPLGVSDRGDRVAVVLNEGVGRREGLGLRLTVVDRVWTRVTGAVHDRLAESDGVPVEYVAVAVVEGVQVPVMEGEAPVAVPDDTLSVQDAVGVQPKLALPVPLGVSDRGDRVGVVLNEGVGGGEGLGVRLTVVDRVRP